MAKNPISQDDLKKHLEQQIGFIKRSAKAFDEGFEDEAKRLALTIRVMLHDTKSSISLLQQLGIKSTLRFHNSSIPDVADNAATYSGLVGLALGKADQPTRFVALLDGGPHVPTKLTFADWWTAKVFGRPDGASMSRQELILTAANQDGGGHVDPALDERYAALQDGTFLGWNREIEGTTTAIEGPERSAIRQIAHEVLRTLNPSMPHQEPDPLSYSGLVMGLSVGLADSAPPEALPWPANVAKNKVGRNELCPCGSSLKFKRCHGR